MIDHTINTETELYQELESIISHTARKIKDTEIKQMVTDILAIYTKSPV